MTDINLNNAECVKTVTSFTEETFYNICTGVTQTIRLGGMDVVVNILILLAVVLILAAVVVVIKESL